MSDAANRFRDRARDCLNLAKSARYYGDRIMLEEMAADLNDEAKRIDAQEADEAATNRAAQTDRLD